MMIATDATLVEINPLAETNDGRIVAADAKLNFDDNAEYRQKQIFAKRDYTQEDPREVEVCMFASLPSLHMSACVFVVVFVI